MAYHANNDNNIRKKLNQAIQEYRLCRERLVTIQANTKEAFAQITNILSPDTSALLECINTTNLDDVATDLGALKNLETFIPHINIDQVYSKMIYEKQLDSAKVEIGNPAIAIVGQVKAGKSTLVNILLKKNVVYQSFEKCTARLTRLTYSNTNYVEIIDQNGKVIKRKKLPNSTIPKHYLQLNENDRNNAFETSKQIRAGIKSNFLESGIDIIDSPGLSENATLTNLSKDMIKTILPLMIYVIDGRGSVKQTDISDLLELKNSVPNLQIIYFVTKLDTEDLSESENQNPIELAELKMEIAFKKLQFNHFIPNSYKHWSECNYFHGASLYAFLDYYKNKITPETVFHYNRLGKFEAALLEFLVRNFQNKIYETSNTIINFLMDVLTKIINHAKIFSDFSQENLHQISAIEKIEKDLYENIKHVITNSKTDLINRLVNRLENESNAIIEPIANIEYPSSIEIPANGILLDKKTIEKCQGAIMYTLCQGLENVIRQFVEEELFTKYRNAIEGQMSTRMKDSIISHNITTKQRTSYELCLERIIEENYKFNSLNSSYNSENYNTIMKLMNAILVSIKKFLSKLFKNESNNKHVDVKSENWKLQQAKECLKRCDHHLLAEEVCRGLLNDFEKKHNSFLNALKNEHVFVHRKIKISENIRMQVAEKAPDFQGLLMLTLEVKSRYMLQGVETMEKIGQGGQGKVYKCVYNGKEMAKKTTKVQIENLNEIAEEVFYSFSFEHPRLLPMIAISINDTDDDDFKEISVYYPLMKCDVLKYIKENLTTFDERMKIAIQVAEALKYLHQQQIMHRDLKLANILLDENNDVFLADYGLCKSMALTGHSLVGTLLHIAPEISRKENYDYRVDIYSFGVLLWYLADGRGQHPRYAKIRNNILSIDMRPERPINIPDSLWDLMQLCWNNDPFVRPSVEFIINQINEILLK